MRRSQNHLRQSFSFNLLRRESGMTLIEILIVMVILGGIMSVLGTTIFTNARKANVRQARIQLEELSKALEVFHTDCGFYPTGDLGLKALLEAPADCKNWGPEPYIKPNMMKDPWKNEFVYEATGSSFVVKSLGADKKEGGSGYDADISTADQ